MVVQVTFSVHRALASQKTFAIFLAGSPPSSSLQMLHNIATTLPGVTAFVANEGSQTERGMVGLLKACQRIFNIRQQHQIHRNFDGLVLIPRRATTSFWRDRYFLVVMEAKLFRTRIPDTCLK
jgi:hypothetical protein